MVRRRNKTRSHHKNDNNDTNHSGTTTSTASTTYHNDIGVNRRGDTRESNIKSTAKKNNKTTSILFIIVAMEILALTIFLFLQGEQSIRYFSNRDFILIRKGAASTASGPHSKETTITLTDGKEEQAEDGSTLSVRREDSPNDEGGRQRLSITFGHYEVLETYPHDSTAFTQGLTYFNGYIYESTGIYGKSSVRKLDPSNNFSLVQEVPIDKKFFGEGMTHFKTSEGDDMFLVLTWKEGTAFIYDHNLHLMESFKYQTETGEGWGITYNTDTGEIIASDGSEYLYIFDLSTRQGSKRLKVHGYIDGDPEERSINMINELEYVSPKDGKTSPYILANVWLQNYILKINPDTGRVMTLYDLSELCPKLKYGSEDVLNGISVTSESDHRIVYITGKLWDKMYKIKLL